MANEDLELDTELEVPTTAELDDLEDDAGSDADDAPTENKWAARRSLSEMLEDDDADKAAAPDKSKTGKESATPTGKNAEESTDDDEDLDDDDLDEDLDEEEEAPKRDAKATQEKPADSAAKARYAVKGADGKAFEFELEPGTSIQFKADGRDVEVKSIDDLVQLAQKGAAFDRKTSEQGQTIQKLTTQTGTLAEQLGTVRKNAEEMLMAALFDREARQKLRQALAPFRDPEFRKGVEAQQELDRQKADTETQQTEAVEAKRAEFWQGIGVEIRKELESAEHLTPDDAMEVAQRFHTGYANSYAAKYAELTAAGTAEAEAQAQANTHALSYFTEKNLRRVVRGLNAELADERKTVAKAKADAKKGAPPKDAKAAKAEADAHNSKTSRRQEQRRTAPRLQGGGAAPGGSGRSRDNASSRSSEAKPRTYAQRMDSAFSLLRKGD